MPKLDHKDLGDTLSYVYLPGLVTAVYPGSKETPDAKKDTADVTIKNGNTTLTFTSCPIFYHCSSSGIARDNGSIENASRGFTVGDEALCRCHIKAAKDSKTETPSFDKVVLVGHVSGVKRCSYKFAFLRIGASELKPLATPLGKWDYSDASKKYVYTAFDKDSHKDEMCIVYDAVTKALASIVDPTKDGTVKYQFPCSVESLKPFLDSVDLELDRELFNWTYQGSAPDTIQFASAYPNYNADFEGKLLGVNATGVPYESYLYDNEVQALFTRFTNNVMSSTSAEISSGKFSRFDSLKASSESSFVDYSNRSPGFLVETRSSKCPGALTGEEKPQFVLDEIARLSAKRIEYKSAASVQKLKRSDLAAVITGLTNEIASAGALLESLVRDFNNSNLSVDNATALAKQISDLSISLESSRSVLARKVADALALDSVIASIEESIAELDGQISDLNSYRASSSPAISPSGAPLANSSYHVQSLYGENEYWLCAKNTYMGIVISYCDEFWKFIRVESIPSTALPAGNPALAALSSGLAPMSPMANVGMAVAASITQSVTNGSIFDYSMLKRFNEGCIHRTTAPAVCGVPALAQEDSVTGSTIKNFNGVGSYLLTQNPHEERADDPSFFSAVNSRLEHIDCWNRYDNWMNSVQLCSHSPQANPTWHFRSFANQWRLSSVYIDTPIGSFLYGAPRLQAGIFYMYQVTVQGSTARNDLPFRAQFTAKTRQTGACCMQIYIVQRQSLTAWNEKVDAKEFVRQALRYGPYDSFNVAENYVAGSEPPTPEIKKQVPSDATYSGDFKPGGGSFGGGGASGSWDGGGLSESDEAPPSSGAVGAINSFVWNNKEKVRFVRKDGKLVDFLTLSDSDKAALVDDRFFIISDTDVSARGSFPPSRNEIEIMASFDTFASLKEKNKDRSAAKALRSKEFESAIKDFIKKFYDDVVDKSSGAVKNKTFSMFYFDAKII